VAGEESDVDPNGTRISHFELYLSAMQQSAASTQEIETFIAQLQQGKAFAEAYAAAQTPSAAQEFVDFTFSTIHSNKAHVQAAIFTFGREDLIPGMFISLVQDIHKAFPDQVSLFKYYLDRHIEIDGDHHSHLALRMTESLCGTEAQHWQEAEEATIQSLNKRIALWNGALQEIVASKTAVAQ
jgi:pyrroloquinoline quinone (PQQ) biosynthesis protein C